jgi:DNA primase
LLIRLEYIRQCAGLLKIDEAGLTTLVNKYKREKITRDEKKAINENQFYPEASETNTSTGNGDLSLTSKDELQERNIIRILLEYGLLPYTQEQTIAEYIFEELDAFSFDNQELYIFYKEYMQWYQTGRQPDTKNMLYHNEASIRNLVASVTITAHELSPRWKEKMEGKKWAIISPEQDAKESIIYFKLKKIKQLLQQNQLEMEHANTPEEQILLIKVHNDLKAIEKDLTTLFGTVILK